MNSSSEIIPIPFKVRIQHFARGYMPWIVFLMLIILAAWLWKSYVVPPAIVGEVQPKRATIISGADGILVELKVELLQQVTNGQLLAIVHTMDSNAVAAELAAIQADLQLMQARMDLDRIRNLDSYSRLKLDLLNEQLSLELARIRFQQAEAEFQRAQKLLEANLTTRGMGPNRNEFGYDVALRDRNALQAEITAREIHIAELQSTLAKLEATGVTNLGSTDPTILKAIDSQMERLKRLYDPIKLFAPFDGFISAINAAPGQRVVRDFPILVVSAAKSDRVIGWIRHPYQVVPKPGDKILVRKYTMGARPITATVISIGQQLEPINPTALPYSTSTQRIELGLPFSAILAESSTLLPGEPVLIQLAR